MKPSRAPNIPGNTGSERFDNAVGMMFSVSKEDLLLREAEWNWAQAKKKRTNRSR